MMTVALAAAQVLADDVDAWGMPVLCALLPMAGMTVLEQQAERARAAGIQSMLVLVDGVPPALAEVCDRIRARGMAVELVRDSQDVLRTAAAAGQLVLIADGMVAGAQAWQAIAGASGQALLVTADVGVTQHLERIDAAARWAGLALIPASALPALADAPAQWDPQLLLLRHAIQAGAQRIACDPALFVSGAMALAQSSGTAQDVGTRLLAESSAAETGLLDHSVLGPVVRLTAGPLLRRQSSGKVARVAVFLFAGLAAALALAGLALPMAIAGVIASLAHVTADFIGRFRPEAPAWRKLGTAGLAAHLAALAIADRAIDLSTYLAGTSAAGTLALVGSGGMTATLAVLAGRWLSHRRLVRPGVLIDLPLTWLLSAGLVPLIGWRAGFDAIGLIAAAGIAIALFINGRHAAADAKDPSQFSPN